MKPKDIKIIYDGEYPNLCSGTLVVVIEGRRWEFPNHSLRSAGGFEDDYSTYQEPWEISEWPQGFPEKFKKVTLRRINEEIDWGCCGGCE